MLHLSLIFEQTLSYLGILHQTAEGADFPKLDPDYVRVAVLLKPGFHPNARNAVDCVRKVRKKRNKRNKITQAKTLRKTGFHSNATHASASQ